MVWRRPPRRRRPTRLAWRLRRPPLAASLVARRRRRARLAGWQRPLRVAARCSVTPQPPLAARSKRSPTARKADSGERVGRRGRNAAGTTGDGLHAEASVRGVRRVTCVAPPASRTSCPRARPSPHCNCRVHAGHAAAQPPRLSTPASEVRGCLPDHLLLASREGGGPTAAPSRSSCGVDHAGWCQRRHRQAAYGAARVKRPAICQRTESKT